MQCMLDRQRRRWSYSDVAQGQPSKRRVPTIVAAHVNRSQPAAAYPPGDRARKSAPGLVVAMSQSPGKAAVML